MPLQLLIVGHLDRAEAKPLAKFLPRVLQPADVRRFAELQLALDALHGATWIPDLIVVIQSWPDEHSAEQIDQLNRLAPLARCVVCYGSWCESDGRTRQLWPLAVRVPLRSAMSRLLTEWQLLNGQSVRVMPMSGSREETYGVDHPALVPGAPVDVAVDSPDPEYRRYLCELLESVGHRIAPLDESRLDERSLIHVVDLDPWEESRRITVVNLKRRHPADRIVGLMNLPDPAASKELQDLGIAAVLPKLGSQQTILDAISPVGKSEKAFLELS
ncbi:MAG: hypothetical protein JSS49_19480 [Planctomycetes bacterium]|nr:hypothetical protein [Planctomycetota bacterium]